MDYLKIRNWEKWQSYRKDRGQPPWIKLHRRLLREPEWVCLTDEQRGQLIAIWLLAADREGSVPASDKVLMRLCHMTSEPDINLFIELGFIANDANVTPTWRQCDDPDKIREEKIREESECIEPNGSTRATSIHFEQFWSHWPIKRNKVKAKRAFLAKKFKIEDIDELIRDVEARKKNDRQWKAGFIPHCSTYLNGERWEDDYGS